MLVLVETPFIDTVRTLAYLRDAMKDCLKRRESPLSAQAGLRLIGALNEVTERIQTTEAAMLWSLRADRIVVYADLGITPEMASVIRLARTNGQSVDYRYLPAWACACAEHTTLGFQLAPDCSRHGQQPTFA